jgi:hypothetical protein
MLKFAKDRHLRWVIALPLNAPLKSSLSTETGQLPQLS